MFERTDVRCYSQSCRGFSLSPSEGERAGVRGIGGVIRIARSPDGHQAEMVAPFRGFMRDATQPHTAAKPIISLGKTINISFSLEASGELAPDATPDSPPWASNTAEPIRGYYLSPPTLQVARGDSGGVLLSWDPGAVGMQLQRTFSLENPDWQVVPGSGTTNQVTWPGGASNTYFRLAQP